ncbi:hypothetical protein CC77DRAFT_1024911 [Alternaria alternata]|uniref:Uncharacterized protein n=1 Tax=Alternaria alternata TaxID=5599 RepID=A0A177D8P1_ALTAL|nr:hypothetical protein CC77DRAFT_1024911 [Alternaria alternata]OAG15550.1 hypothetical protein CC77DRAFT_1024911 [Alternaria alternata]
MQQLPPRPRCVMNVTFTTPRISQTSTAAILRYPRTSTRSVYDCGCITTPAVPAAFRAIGTW